jgi:hypothetical protein
VLDVINYETKQIILDFKICPVLNVVLLLLDDSVASELYVSTFRNTLYVPSSWLVHNL